MRPFENRGALGKVLKNVWGLFHIILFLKYAKEPYAIGSKLIFELLKILGHPTARYSCFKVVTIDCYMVEFLIIFSFQITWLEGYKSIVTFLLTRASRTTGAKGNNLFTSNSRL